MALAAQTLNREVNRLLSTALEHTERRLHDNVFDHEPGIKALLGLELGDFGSSPGQQGDGKRVITGPVIDMRHNLGKGPAKNMAGGYDTHGTSPSDTKRYSRADWTHYSTNVTVSESEILMSSGPEALGNLVAEETEIAMTSLADLLSDHLWATSTGPNAFTGIDALVSAADTVQTLDGTNYPTWNSRGMTARGTAAASIDFEPTTTSFASAGISNMLTCFNNASEGSVMPNVHFTDYATHERYEGSLTPEQRFTPRTVGDGTFSALAFKGKPIWASPKVASGRIYMLHVGSRGIQFKVLRGADFTFGEFKDHTNQEVRTAEGMWKGQLCISDRRFCNKMTGITD